MMQQPKLSLPLLRREDRLETQYGRPYAGTHQAAGFGVRITRLLDMPRKLDTSGNSLGYVVKALDGTQQLGSTGLIPSPFREGDIETVTVDQKKGRLHFQTSTTNLDFQVDYADGTLVGICHIHRQDPRSAQKNPYALSGFDGSPANCGLELEVVEDSQVNMASQYHPQGQLASNIPQPEDIIEKRIVVARDALRFRKKEHIAMAKITNVAASLWLFVDIMLLTVGVYYADMTLDFLALKTLITTGNPFFFATNLCGILLGTFWGVYCLFSDVLPTDPREVLLVGMLVPLHLHVFYLGMMSFVRGKKHHLLMATSFGEACLESVTSALVQLRSILWLPHLDPQRKLELYLSVGVSVVSIALAFMKFDMKDVGVAGYLPGAVELRSGVYVRQGFRLFLVFLCRLSEIGGRLAIVALFQHYLHPYGGWIVLLVDFIVLVVLTRFYGGQLVYVFANFFGWMNPILERHNALGIPAMPYYFWRLLQTAVMVCIIWWKKELTQSSWRESLARELYVVDSFLACYAVYILLFPLIRSGCLLEEVMRSYEAKDWYQARFSMAQQKVLDATLQAAKASGGDTKDITGPFERFLSQVQHSQLGARRELTDMYQHMLASTGAVEALAADADLAKPPLAVYRSIAIWIANMPPTLIGEGIVKENSEMARILHRLIIDPCEGKGSSSALEHVRCLVDQGALVAALHITYNFLRVVTQGNYLDKNHGERRFLDQVVACLAADALRAKEVARYKTQLAEVLLSCMVMMAKTMDPPHRPWDVYPLPSMRGVAPMAQVAPPSPYGVPGQALFPPASFQSFPGPHGALPSPGIVYPRAVPVAPYAPGAMTPFGHAPGAMTPYAPGAMTPFGHAPGAMTPFEHAPGAMTPFGQAPGAMPPVARPVPMGSFYGQPPVRMGSFGPPQGAMTPPLVRPMVPQYAIPQTYPAPPALQRLPSYGSFAPNTGMPPPPLPLPALGNGPASDAGQLTPKSVASGYGGGPTYYASPMTPADSPRGFQPIPTMGGAMSYASPAYPIAMTPPMLRSPRGYEASRVGPPSFPIAMAPPMLRSPPTYDSLQQPVSMAPAMVPMALPTSIAPGSPVMRNTSGEDIYLPVTVDVAGDPDQPQSPPSPASPTSLPEVFGSASVYVEVAALQPALSVEDDEAGGTPSESASHPAVIQGIEPAPDSSAPAALPYVVVTEVDSPEFCAVLPLTGDSKEFTSIINLLAITTSVKAPFVSSSYGIGLLNGASDLIYTILMSTDSDMLVQAMCYALVRLLPSNPGNGRGCQGFAVFEGVFMSLTRHAGIAVLIDHLIGLCPVASLAGDSNGSSSTAPLYERLVEKDEDDETDDGLGLQAHGRHCDTWAIFNVILVLICEGAPQLPARSWCDVQRMCDRLANAQDPKESTAATPATAKDNATPMSAALMQTQHLEVFFKYGYAAPPPTFCSSWTLPCAATFLNVFCSAACGDVANLKRLCGSTEHLAVDEAGTQFLLAVAARYGQLDAISVLQQHLKDVRAKIRCPGNHVQLARVFATHEKCSICGSSGSLPDKAPVYSSQCGWCQFQVCQECIRHVDGKKTLKTEWPCWVAPAVADAIPGAAKMHLDMLSEGLPASDLGMMARYIRHVHDDDFRKHLANEFNKKIGSSQPRSTDDETDDLVALQSKADLKSVDDAPFVRLGSCVRSAIAHAAGAGHTDVVNALLKNSTGYHLKRALICAVEGGHIQASQVLVEKCSSRSAQEACLVACGMGHETLAAHLLQKVATTFSSDLKITMETCCPPQLKVVADLSSTLPHILASATQRAAFFAKSSLVDLLVRLGMNNLNWQSILDGKLSDHPIVLAVAGSNLQSCGVNLVELEQAAQDFASAEQQSVLACGTYENALDGEKRDEELKRYLKDIENQMGKYWCEDGDRPSGLSCAELGRACKQWLVCTDSMYRCAVGAVPQAVSAAAKSAFETEDTQRVLSCCSVLNGLLRVDYGDDTEYARRACEEALKLAASYGNQVLLNELLGAPQKLAAQQKAISKALLRAVDSKQATTIPTLAEALLKARASIDDEDERGRRPLGIAIDRMHDASVSHLLAIGADPNKPSKYNRFPESELQLTTCEDIDHSMTPLVKLLSSTSPSEGLKHVERMAILLLNNEHRPLQLGQVVGDTYTSTRLPLPVPSAPEPQSPLSSPRIASHSGPQQVIRHVEQWVDVPVAMTQEEIVHVPQVQQAQRVVKREVVQTVEVPVVVPQEEEVYDVPDGCKIIEVEQKVDRIKVEEEYVEMAVPKITPVDIPVQYERVVYVPRTELQLVSKSEVVEQLAGAGKGSEESKKKPTHQETEKPSGTEASQAVADAVVVEIPIVKQRHVPMIQKVQKHVMVPQIEYVDQVVDVPIVKHVHVPLIQKVTKQVKFERPTDGTTEIRVPKIVENVIVKREKKVRRVQVTKTQTRFVPQAVDRQVEVPDQTRQVPVACGVVGLAANQNMADVIATLLERKADPNQILPEDYPSLSGLHLAVLNGQHELVSKLLYEKADPMLTSERWPVCGRTALHAALDAHSASVRMTLLLLERAPKPAEALCREDAFGVSPLELLCNHSSTGERSSDGWSKVLWQSLQSLANEAARQMSPQQCAKAFDLLSRIPSHACFVTSNSTKGFSDERWKGIGLDSSVLPAFTTDQFPRVQFVFMRIYLPLQFSTSGGVQDQVLLSWSSPESLRLTSSGREGLAKIDSPSSSPGMFAGIPATMPPSRFARPVLQPQHQDYLGDLKEGDTLSNAQLQNLALCEKISVAELKDKLLQSGEVEDGRQFGYLKLSRSDSNMTDNGKGLISMACDGYLSEKIKVHVEGSGQLSVPARRWTSIGLQIDGGEDLMLYGFAGVTGKFADVVVVGSSSQTGPEGSDLFAKLCERAYSGSQKDVSAVGEFRSIRPGASHNKIRMVKMGAGSASPYVGVEFGSRGAKPMMFVDSRLPDSRSAETADMNDAGAPVHLADDMLTYYCDLPYGEEQIKCARNSGQCPSCGRFQKKAVSNLKVLRPQETPCLAEQIVTGAKRLMQKESGKYYHEVKFGDVSEARIGWLTEGFLEGDVVVGVGDDSFGWGVDAKMEYKVTNGEKQLINLDKQVLSGDVIGCAVDLAAGVMRFSVNGDWVPAAEMRFDGTGHSLYPAVSMIGPFEMHLTKAKWQYKPPEESYEPWANTGRFTRPRSLQEDWSNPDVMMVDLAMAVASDLPGRRWRMLTMATLLENLVNWPSIPPEFAYTRAAGLFDQDANTLLHVAAKRAASNEHAAKQVVRNLSEFCPDLIGKKNKDGQTPKDIAPSLFK